MANVMTYLREFHFASVALRLLLAMMLGQYNYHMMAGSWAALAAESGIRTDISRFGAQVINGIGFIGAGTILVTSKQEVKGLTTAAGLWASACMGLAIGAGFYECAILAFILMFISIRLLPYVENFVVENGRNMGLYVEFESLDDIGAIIGCLKAQNVQIYEVDIDHGHEEYLRHPSAVFAIRLNQKMAHTQILAAITDLACVRVINEV